MEQGWRWQSRRRDVSSPRAWLGFRGSLACCASSLLGRICGLLPLRCHSQVRSTVRPAPQLPRCGLFAHRGVGSARRLSRWTVVLVTTLAGSISVAAESTATHKFPEHQDSEPAGAGVGTAAGVGLAPLGPWWRGVAGLGPTIRAAHQAGPAAEWPGRCTSDHGNPPMVRFWVVASRNDGRGPLWVQRWTDGRWRQARRGPLASFDDHHPAIAAGGGEIWVVWVSSRGSGSGRDDELFVARWQGEAVRTVAAAAGGPGNTDGPGDRGRRRRPADGCLGGG